MYSVTLTVSDEERDDVIAGLWEAGTAGVTESEDWLRAFFDDSSDPASVLSRFHRYQPHLEREEERDWVEESRKPWQSVAVGERFFLVPEWRDDPAPCGRIRLFMRPGMACGSGDHPATRLCLMALEREALDRVPLLDVGTGSGILAEAAVLLGADPVYGCDIDPEATAVARRNLARTPRAVRLFSGSLRSVRDESVGAVVANLNAATVRTLSRDAVRVLRPGGRLIVSGFREDEATKVAPMFPLPERDRLELDGWTCLIF